MKGKESVQRTWKAAMSLGLSLALSLLSLSFAGMAEAQKLGISSSFGDVTMQNVKPGVSYPLKQIKGHGYSLTNLSEVAVDLIVEIVPPIQGSLRPYYEEIPDVSWVRVTPEKLHLEPGASGGGEVTLRVPNDRHWKDRHYQCALYAHTVQGSFLNVGIYDKLFFSTGAGPEAAKAAGPHIDFVPEVLRLGPVRTGKAFESASAKARLKIRNWSDAQQRVRIETVAHDGKTNIPRGFETAAEPRAVQMSAETVEVGAGRAVEVPFRLLLDRGTAGKRLAFPVRARTEEAGWEASGLILVESMAVAAQAPKSREPSKGRPVAPAKKVQGGP